MQKPKIKESDFFFLSSPPWLQKVIFFTTHHVQCPILATHPFRFESIPSTKNYLTFVHHLSVLWIKQKKKTFPNIWVLWALLWVAWKLIEYLSRAVFFSSKNQVWYKIRKNTFVHWSKTWHGKAAVLIFICFPNEIMNDSFDF